MSLSSPNTLYFSGTEDTSQTLSLTELRAGLAAEIADGYSISGIGTVVGGSAQLQADGSIAFTPAQDFHGTARIEYILSDGNEMSPVVAEIAVAEVNDYVRTESQNIDAVAGETLEINHDRLIAGAYDADGDTLSVIGVGPGTIGGSAVLLDNGNIQFTPADGFTGNASIRYYVDDGRGGTNIATMSINVTEADSDNAAPVVIADVDFTGLEDEMLRISASQLLSQASDADGDMLRINMITDSVGGRAVLRSDGSVHFIPDADFSGQAQFSYIVSDGKGGQTTARALIDIQGSNDAPVAADAGRDISLNQTVAFTPDDLLAQAVDADGDVLSISAIGESAGGSAELLSDGSVVFTPQAGFLGMAYFDYSISDGNGGTDSARMFLNVAATNTDPNAVNLAANGLEDTSIAFSTAAILARAEDADGDSLSLTTVNAIHGGTVELADGLVRFTPDENFFGQAAFDYTISDGRGGSDTARFFINVAEVNDDPDAPDLATDGEEDRSLLFSTAAIVSRASDVDGDVLSLSHIGETFGGGVQIFSNGTLRFTPDENFFGVAYFDYTIVDGRGGSDTARFFIDVAELNDPPITPNLGTSGVEDQPLTFSAAALLAQASDVDGDTLSIIGLGGSHGGSAQMLANGNLHFVPQADFHGQAYFDYIISDGRGGLDSARLFINIAEVNDAPIAPNLIVDALEDQSLEFSSASLLSKAVDVDGDVLSISSVGQAQGGSVELLDDGTVRFTPESNFHGQAYFDYLVSDGRGGVDLARMLINIAEANDAPVAADSTIDALEDQALDFSAATLLANTIDADGDTLSISAIGDSEGGTAEILADGTVRFTPESNFHGQAYFDYQVSDGRGGSDTARVSINIAEVNDAPVVPDQSVTAADHQVLSFSAATLLFNASDADGDTLSIAGIDNSFGGTVERLADGGVQFTPNAGFSGEAYFDYRVKDEHGAEDSARFSIHISAENRDPIAPDQVTDALEDTVLDFSTQTLLNNAFDPDGNALSISSVSNAVGGRVEQLSDGTVRFRPDDNFHGQASFEYRVADGQGGSDIARMVINYASVNDRPYSPDQTNSIPEDTAVIFSTNILLKDAIDVDGNPAAIEVIDLQNVQGGSAQLLSDGSIRFQGNPEYHGTAYFDYVIADAQGGRYTTRMVLDVREVNDRPIVPDHSFTAQENRVLTFETASLLSGTVDIEGDAVRITGADHAVNGSVRFENNRIIFDPTDYFYGNAGFRFEVTDARGAVEYADVNIRYTEVNYAPHVPGVTLGAINEDTDLIITRSDLLRGARDFDGDSLTITNNASVNTGIIYTHGANDYRYVPPGNYHGPVEIQYEVSDGRGGFTQSTVRFNINPVNDSPFDRSGTLNAQEDVATVHSVDLLAGDIDGDRLTLVHAYGAQHGRLGISADGRSIIYTSDLNYNGTDSYSYIVSDGTTTFTGTTDVNVLPVNDAPIILDVIQLGISVVPMGTIIAVDPEGDPLTYTIDRQPEHGSVRFGGYLDNEPPGWSYDYGRCDPYNGNVTFDIRVTDSHGASSVVTITERHVGSECGKGGGGSLPVVLDLDGDGLEFTQLDDDNVLTTPGTEEMLAAWVAPDDGLLVYDYDGDRRVTNENEVAFVDYLAGARTDLEGLAAFDEDGDGKLSANDSVWQQFGVWQDANSNGVTDDGEFLDLDDLDITAINLSSDQRPYHDGGALVFGTGSYELADGSEAELGDVAFLYQDNETQDDLSEPSDLSDGDDIAQTYLQFISNIAAGSKAEAQAIPPDLIEQQWNSWVSDEEQQALA